MTRRFRRMAPRWGGWNSIRSREPAKKTTIPWRSLKPAYWDISALVPSCAQQKASSNLYRLLGRYEIVTWWGTPVEIRSSLERLVRMGQLTATECSDGETRLKRLRRTWREVLPDDGLRSEAESLLHRFPLSATDALQLAAATTWTGGRSQGKIFICGDARLLEAARQVGFQGIEP